METVSVNGLPNVPYLTPNLVSRDFTIAFTSDLAFLGIYNITIASTFTQPSISGVSSQVTKSTGFQLIVSPCTVLSYSILSTVNGTVSYTLGDPSFSFGPYQFSQSPNCGYNETVSITGLPIGTYLTHNSVNRNFTIVKTSISDYAFLGVYNATIQSQFMQPNIFGGPTAVTKEIIFQLIVSPCTVT